VLLTENWCTWKDSNQIRPVIRNRTTHMIFLWKWPRYHIKR
jgi:hypothetical protein